MSRYKHLADLLKICSVLPALAVMPAFAAVDITEGQVIENQTNNDGANQNAAGLTITYGDSLTTSGVNNVTFNNNSSVNSGGAMKALNGFVAGDGWTFTNNHSDKISGGLYVKIPENDESKRNIVFGNGTTFSGNTSKWLGGALGIESAGTVTIGDNTKFESNSTDADGGAIAIWTDKSNGATSGTELTLGRTDFTGNTAANRGGAIANLNNDETENKTDFYNTVNIASGSTFTGNSAKTGGAIYNLGTMNVDGTFDGNSTTATRGHGGAIYNAGEMSVAGTLKNNTATNAASQGGAIYNSGTLAVADSAVFSGNSTDTGDGGAIYNSGTLNIGDNVTFSGNTGDGTLFMGTGATTTIGDNVKFVDNTHGTRGLQSGAIYLGNNGNLTIGKDALFQGNKATQTGGAITASYADSHLTIADYAQFIANSSTKAGGALYLGSNNMNLGSDFIFVNNTATQGGAIFYNSMNTNLALNNFTFSGNEATDTAAGIGGAIAVGTNAAGELNIADSLFDSNTAAIAGGAISQANGSTAMINIDESIFKSNSVEAEGGAIVSDATMTITNSEFIGNKTTGTVKIEDVEEGQPAYYANNGGGAIFLYDQSNTTVRDSVFSQNSSGTYGGAISTRIGASAENSSLTIDGATFTDNTAGVNGGAIYNTVAMTLNGENVFSGNMAGGAANDIHNIGTMTVASGTTTLGGGITGNGALTIADGATLDIGTTTVEQASIDIDGTLNASMLSSDNYGKLLADSITTGENGKLQLTIGSVGTYDIFGGIAHEDITIDAGLAYDVINNGADGIEIAIKAVEDIAADTGLSNQGAATIAALANTDDDVLTAISLRAQTELAAGNVDYVEHETAKLNPENKPVAHSISSSVQNQVLSLAAGRMTGGTVGRSGGDLANADYGIWAQGLYNHSKLNGQFKGDTTGISVGADALIDGKYTIGIGYAYNDTDVDSDSRDTKIESNSLFLYGQYKPNNWYVNAALNYTMGNYTETSNPFGVQFESEYDVDSFGGQVMTGYDFASGLTPEIGARYLHISQDAYDVALGHVDGADMDYLTGVAGIRYAFEIESDMELKFRPELRAAATYDFLSDAAVATITAPGSVSYVIDADRLSRFGGEFGIGLAAEWRGLTVSLNYDLDLHEDYTSQTGMLKFRYDF